MATYNKDPYKPAEVRCDEHSTFRVLWGETGWPEEGREWVPKFGDACTECGAPC